MSSGVPPDDIRSSWVSQPTQPLRLSPEEIRDKARGFSKTIHRRNVRELLAAVFVIVFFAWQAWVTQGVTARVGNGLIVAAALYVAYRLITHASSRPPPPDAMAAACLAFHRRELERQRDLLRTVWRWYLGPFVPGFLVLLVDRASRAVTAGPGALSRVGISAAIGAALFLAIGWLNKAGARKLDAELESLETVDEG